MSSQSSSEQSDFNFQNSPTGPLSSGGFSDSDSSLDFSPFDYLTSSNNAGSDPSQRQDNQVLMGQTGELTSLPLFEDMLGESVSSGDESGPPFYMSSAGSSRQGSGEELDTDDPFWEFIDEPKYPPDDQTEEEGSDDEEEEEEETENDEEEDEETEDDGSAYDGDDDEP